MENVLNWAKSLGLKFDKKLERLAELQELLKVAEHQRAVLDEKGRIRRSMTCSSRKFGRKLTPSWSRLILLRPPDSELSL